MDLSCAALDMLILVKNVAGAIYSYFLNGRPFDVGLGDSFLSMSAKSV